MSLIDDDQIPRQGEHILILNEITAHLAGAAQILERGKVDVVIFLTKLRVRVTLESPQALASVFGAVGKLWAIPKDFVEVLKPALVDHRAMSNDDGAA